MNVAAHPFVLVAVNGFVAGDRREFVVRRFVGHETAFLMDALANNGHRTAVIQPVEWVKLLRNPSLLP